MKAPIKTLAFLLICFNKAAAQHINTGSKGDAWSLEKPSVRLYDSLMAAARNFVFTNADSSILLDKKALQTARQLKIDSLIASSSYSIASLEASRNNYDSALRYCDTAYKYFSLYPNKHNLAMVRNVQGGVYMASGHNEQAAKMYFAAIDYTKDDTSNNRILITYHNVVTLLNNMGRHAEALTFAMRQFNLASKLKDNDEIAYAASNVSDTYMLLSDSMEAKKFIRSFLAVSKHPKDPYLNIIRNNEAALLNYLDKRYGMAVEYFNKSLELNAGMVDKQMECFTLLNLGRTYQRLGNMEKSDDCFKRVLLLCEELKIKEEKRQAYELLMQNATATGDFKKAYSYLNLLSALKDSLLNEKSQSAIIDAQTRYDMLEKQQQIDILGMEKKLHQSDLQQKKNEEYIILFAVLIALILSALFFNRYKLKKRIQEQQALLNERTRISRELHDDLGGGLSTIKLMTEMAKDQKFGLDKNYLENISDKSKELVQNMNEIVWSLNNNNDTLVGLVSYIRQYAGQFLQEAGIALEFEQPVLDERLFINGICRRHIFLILKEALNNIVKHAQASLVQVRIGIGDNFIIRIKDNGKGLPAAGNGKRTGNGLSNMQERVKQMNGSLEIETGVPERILSYPFRWRS